MLARVQKAWREGRRASVIVMVSVTTTLMAGFTALTIDLGNMYMVRTELQRSADAAALAATAKLTQYQAGTSEAAARQEARRIVEANPVQGRQITIDPATDVVFGTASWSAGTGRYTFSSGGTVPTAVRVTIRLTADSPNGPVYFFFANLWGMQSRGMWAQASAMIIPRDIAVVGDLSGSMNDDSELQQYKDISINLWSIWVCLPVEKGRNGIGNGWTQAPAGIPVDQTGRLYADPAQHPEYKGPVWGRMNNYGTLTITSSYNPANDPGLIYLPYGQSWSSNTVLKNWLASVGYNTSEINAIVSSTYDSSCYKYRVAVALGLYHWRSGISGGLWSIKHAAAGNGNTKVESSELDTGSPLAPYLWPQGSWLEYIDSYVKSNGTAMYGVNHSLQYRYGIKTLVNYLLENRNHYADTPDLAHTPEQPVQAVKDAVGYCMDLIAAQESDDQVSLEIFAQTAHHMQNLTRTYNVVSNTLSQMQAGHYDDWTFTGGGIDKAINELTSARARPNAAKIVFLLSDGQANVNQQGGTDDYSGGKTYAEDRARAAVNLGIKFYCVSVGENADRPFMQRIAAMGGEEFFAAGTIDQYSAQLMNIFAELSGKRPTRLID